MKRIFVILILIASMLFTGCEALINKISASNGMVSQGNEKQQATEGSINQYIINAEYDREDNVLKGHEKIIYNNDQGIPISNIVLYLYPNLYRKLETVPAIGIPSKCYPEGFTPGYIELSSLKVSGMEIDESWSKEVSRPYMDIKLEKLLKESESIELEMDFILKIPVSTTRFGRYNDITQFTYWYPQLAAQQSGEWQIRDYYSIGESNYSDIADYQVEISLLDDEIVASTGSIISEKESSKEGYKVVEIEAQNVRDFTWVSSPNFIVEESIIDGVKIKNYYTPKNKKLGSKADEIGADVISYYNSIFGNYLYDEFDIVETYLTGGGMEYPQLITLGQGHYQDIDKLNSVIAHEGAHQWWYAAVGSDEHETPWLDEGFANYSGQLYLAHKAGTDDYLNSLMKKYEDLKAADIAIEASVTSFNTWKDYNDVIYKKGAAALHKLRNNVGDEKFFEILQTYYSRYKLKNAKISDFLSVVEDIAGEGAAHKIELK